jgi:uncharacterized protein YfaS (alpha-2-macroglobulin family)
LAASADDLTVTARTEREFPEAMKGLWAVRLVFNHPVFATDLAEKIEVLVDKKKEPFALVDPETGKPAKGALRDFRVLSKKAPENTVKIIVRVKKGLSDGGGRRLLAKKMELRRVFRVKRVYVKSHSTFYRGPKDKGVTLRISTRVSPGELKRVLKVKPKVKNLRISRGRWWGRIDVRGDFEFKREYELKIGETRLGDGGTLFSEHSIEFKGPGIEPAVSVRTERSLVELKSRQLFPVSLENVDNLRVSLERIPPFLVPQYAEKLKDKKGPDARFKKDRLAELDKLVKSGAIPKTFAAKPVVDKEVFFAREAIGRVYGYSVPLSFRKNPERGGAWLADFTTTVKKSAKGPRRIIRITDLSIMYKLSAKTLLIWTTSIHSGLPVSGVEIMLRGAKGDCWFPGKTDKDGLLVLKAGERFPAIRPADKSSAATKIELTLKDAAWIVAATGSDSSAIRLSKERLKPFGVKQASAPNADFRAVRGTVFTERGIYRPGEKVFFKAVVRQYKEKKTVAPAGSELRVKIIGPRDDVKYDKTLTLNDFGTCHGALETRKSYPTGLYTIKAKPQKLGDTDETFERTFLVQEYKRPRHFVKLSFTQGEEESRDYIGLNKRVKFVKVDVSAGYYTGGPVKHAKARWKATLVPVTKKIKGLAGFFFGNGKGEPAFLESGEGTLDKLGKMTIALPLDARMMSGLFGVKVSVTVLDVDGEPATDVGTYSPEPAFRVGVSSHPTQVQPGYSATLKIIVIGRDGKRVQEGMINASLMKKRYYRIQKRNDAGNINYLWEEGWVKSVGSTIPLSKGEAKYEIELNDYGETLLAFTYEGGKGSYSGRTFFKVGWDEYDEWRRNRSDESVLAREQILPATNKKHYRVGEDVDVAFSAGRPVKKCLVTLEAADILSYKVVDVNGKRGKYRFKATADQTPNVFISITAPVGREGFPMYRSSGDADIPTLFFGYADIKIGSQVKALKLEIAPGKEELKGRPGERASIAFKVTNDKGKGTVAEMAVCVVDESLLALTRFATPGLDSLTDFRFPLGVFSGDLRLALVSQDLARMLSTKPLTGGGMGSGFVGPSIRKDFRPVAYFNPTVVTDGSGVATVSFKLPDTTTAYRVYAVACDKTTGFVSGDRKMVVTKEFFVDPSLPRFLIPGDRATFPVALHNKTADPGDVALKSEGTKDLLVKPTDASATLEPRSASTVFSTVEVRGGPENGKLLFQGTFKGKEKEFSDAVEKVIPIHSRYLPANRVLMGHFVKDAEIRVDLPSDLKRLDPKEIVPEDFTANLSISTTNWNRLAPGMKYLLRYPYGCVEQTSSGVIPLAALRGLVKEGLFPGIDIETVDKFLKRGVERLLAMQTSGGGFTYWPGGSEPSWWGTQYATFALTIAARNGFDVPKTSLEKAAKFTRAGLLKDVKNDRYGHRGWSKELGVYNAAAHGALNTTELGPFFKDYETLGAYQKALLLLAAEATKHFPEVVLRKMVGRLDPKNDPHATDYYNSSYRAVAACLMAAVEIGGQKEKAAQWAGDLLTGLRPQGRWYSTADTGWCLLALGTYFKNKEVKDREPLPCAVTVGREKVLDAVLKAASVDVDINPFELLERPDITIKCERGEGDVVPVNYTLSLTYPDLGTSPSDLNHGFTLHKRMENLNGKDEIRVGDYVRVTLEMDLPGRGGRYYGRRYEYVALVDPVPAGLVPVSANLASEGAAAENDKGSGDRDGFSPNHSEFRDDGVRVFKDRAWSGSYRYSYLARAAMAGDFWMRGSRISLMYGPDVFGKTKGKRVKILPAKK